MKRILLIALIILSISCQKNEIENEATLQGVIITKNTDEVSALTARLRITHIELKNIKVNMISYNFSGEITNFNTDEFNPNIKELTIRQLKDGNHEVFYKDGLTKLEFSKDQKQILVSFEGETVEFENLNFEVYPRCYENEVLTLCVLYNEMTNEELYREPNIINKSACSKCSFLALRFDSTRTLSDSGAEELSKEWLKSHSDCEALKGTSSGCIWGDFGCISAVSIECNGKTCE